MLSYIKTQWWRLLIALYFIVVACIYAVKPAPEVLTVEALDEVMSNMITASMHFTCFVSWSFISFINYNQDCIKMLEKKTEKYDAMYDLVQELLETDKVYRQYTEYADHPNRKIESFITEYKKNEKRK